MSLKKNKIVRILKLIQRKGKAYLIFAFSSLYRRHAEEDYHLSWVVWNLLGIILTKLHWILLNINTFSSSRFYFNEEFSDILYTMVESSLGKYSAMTEENLHGELNFTPKNEKETQCFIKMKWSEKNGWWPNPRRFTFS